MFSIEISTFLGRFHPLIVHFPIGFIFLGILIETYTNIIKLNDELTIEMKYPDIDYFTKINFVGDEPDPYELVAKCIKRVYVGEDDYTPDSEQESRDWVEGLNSAQFEGIQEFFETMPSLKHVLKVKNPKTKVVNEVVLEGLSDFFA